MFKKTGLVILALLFIATITFAGQIKQLTCDYCGFKSSEVFEGAGKSGIEKTIVYCPKCKDFFAIPTKRAFQTQANMLIKTTNWKGYSKFMGRTRLVYSCPVCNGDAYVYDGPVCPACKKGKLKTENIGDWD
ncbi:MAG: hypothetical protein V1650_04485 [Candidatus Omnitrophota bacterium]